MSSVKAWSNGMVVLLPADGVESDRKPDAADFGLPPVVYRGGGSFMRHADERTEALASRLVKVWNEHGCLGGTRPGPVVVSLPPAKSRVLAYLKKRLSRNGISLRFLLPGDTVEVLTPPSLENRSDSGPFDIVGDIHGCATEFRQLLRGMGYVIAEDGVISHPAGRLLVSVGDVLDKGPEQVECLKLMLASWRAGTALWVRGNHEDRVYRLLRRYLEKGVTRSDPTLDAILSEGRAFAQEVHDVLSRLSSHMVLDDGRLVVTHAAHNARQEGSMCGPMQTYGMFGATTGKFEGGLPERLDWTKDYDGRATVVYGHVPGKTVRVVGRTVCVDTGCYKTGRLSAWSWPERVIHST